MQDIQVGDQVLTRDNGYQTVIWRGGRNLSTDDLRDAPDLTPIRIAAEALGPGLPERDLLVSPEHRMLLSGRQVEAWTGKSEALIGARYLTCYPGVTQASSEDVTYIHIMFERHEVILAEGCWTESFHLQNTGSDDLAAEAQRKELVRLFPELEDMPVTPTARPVIDTVAFYRDVVIAAE